MNAEELTKLLRDPKVLRELHEKSDANDVSKDSLHHRVGPLSSKVAVGNHVHGRDGYSTVAVPTTRYALSTVAAGMLTVVGRNPGDFHYNTTTGREYVLTGAPISGGVTFTDNFDRANTALGAGLGGSWIYPTPFLYDFYIQSNHAQSYNGQKSSALFESNSGDGYIEFYRNRFYLQPIFRCSGNNFLTVDLESGIVYYGTVNAITTYIGAAFTPITIEGLVGVDFNGTTIRVYFNNLLIFTGISAINQTATKHGFFTNLTGGDPTLNWVDNFAYTPGLGTLAWTPVDSNVEPNYVANSGTALTLPNYDVASFHKITLTGNCTLGFPSIATIGTSFTLELVQDATGSRTVTWPATVKWAGGTAPTLTTTAAKKDVLSFMYDGSFWLGFVAGQNY